MADTMRTTTPGWRVGGENGMLPGAVDGPASADAVRRLLRARAKALANERPSDQAAQGIVPVVEFVLAAEHYALEVSYVREVCPLHALTVLPATPPFLLGVMSLHGQILPVVDIKKLLDLPERGLTDLNKVIVLQQNASELGILADTIAGVRDVRLDELQTSIPALSGARADYLRGLTKERLTVLDGGRLLADRRLTLADTAKA